MHDRKAILAAFRSCRHTPTSRQILEGLDSGTLRVIFRKRMPDFGRANGKTIQVEATRPIPDILATLVHEGRHYFDILEGQIPEPNRAQDSELLIAEVRAYCASYHFARGNDFRETKVYSLFQRDPLNSLVSILESPGLQKISNAEGLEVYQILVDLLNEGI